MFGILAGFLLATLAVSLYAAATPHGQRASQYGEEVVSLVGLWIGCSAPLWWRHGSPGARHAHQGPAGDGAAAAGRAGRRGTGSVVARLRAPAAAVAGHPARDPRRGGLPVPARAGGEAPLLPFVHHLYTRLGHPAQTLTATSIGPGLVVLAVLVCVGSPVVEELFFRGLLLRALLGKLRRLGPRLGPAVSIVITALVFALVHFEALQFLGLAGFGVVLGCWLAHRDASGPRSSPTWPSTPSRSSPS